MLMVPVCLPGAFTPECRAAAALFRKGLGPAPPCGGDESSGTNIATFMVRLWEALCGKGLHPEQAMARLLGAYLCESWTHAHYSAPLRQGGA